MIRRLALALSLGLAACGPTGSVQKGSTSASSTSAAGTSGTTGVIAGPTGPSTSASASASSSSATSTSGTTGSSASSASTGTSGTSTSASSSSAGSTSATSSSSAAGTTGTSSSAATTSSSATASSSGAGTTTGGTTASSSSSSSSSSGGTTGAALSVVGYAFAQNTPTDNLVIDVTFNEAVDPASLTVDASGGACTGTLQLSSDGFATCVPLTSPALDPSGAVASTQTNAPLAGGTAYRLRVKAAVRSLGQAQLGSDVTSSPYFTALDSPTGLQAAPRLQSITLDWQGPTSSRLQRYKVAWSKTGSAPGTAISQFVNAPPFEVTGLEPFTSYDLQVQALDVDGKASTPATLTASTAFSGSTADWRFGQQLTGAAGRSFYVAWTATDLVVGLSAPDADGGVVPEPLGAGDALWLAVDTDPAADTAGEVSTTTLGSNDVIWPFRADFVAELKVTGPASTAVSLRDASGNAWTAQPDPWGWKGEVTELRVPRAALGNPGEARLALIAVNTTNGFTFDLAPANPAATDVLGFFASLTAGLAPGSALWSPGAPVDQSPLAPAPALVTIGVSGAPGPGPVQVRGSLHPLSYDLSLSSYRLAAGAGGATGVFNFGGSTQELFFQLADNGATEPGFGPGQDRVYTLSGASEAVPTLTFGQPYSATHAFQLTFACSTGGSPTEVRGNVSELGDFTSAGAPVTGTSPARATVDLSSHDFLSTPLAFKLFYADQSYEGGTDHTMNDDVINRRVLAWSAGDGQGF